MQMAAYKLTSYNREMTDVIPHIHPLLKGGKANYQDTFCDIHHIPPVKLFGIGIAGCFGNESC